ncbi:MAG: class II aldolase/adducin family protein [Gemmatimonadota bacterium]
MSRLSPWIGGTRRFVGHVGQYGLLLGPFRRALVEPAAAASDEALRLLLCYHGKLAWQAGLIAGRCGNLSARLRSGKDIYITPRAVNKARLSAFDIQLVHLHSATTTGDENVSVELPMHRACYLADPGVGAVIHTHAPALTALGIRGLDLQELLPEAAQALGPISTIPHLPSGSWELADAVGSAVIGGAKLILLAHHGAVAVGSGLAEAYDRMEFGELTAKTALLAAGEPRSASV